MTPEDDPRPATPPPHPPRKVSRRASIIGTVIALLVLAGIAWLAWTLTQNNAPVPSSRPGGGAGGPRGAPATTVGVATAERADLSVVLEALGTVTPTATAIVRPQVSGVLNEVQFQEGQMVTRGQLLAQLDARPFELQLMQATGQRMKDEAQLENARLTLDRFRKLLELDSIARQEVDTQAALVKQLEATVITSRAQEGTARLNLAYTRITAPISGRVGLRVVDVGNLVGSNDAEGIAVIAQLAPIDVEFSIPQDSVPEVQARVRAGAKLPVEALDRTRTNVLETGAFASLDNVVDTQTGTVKAKARFLNAKSNLFPAQFVNVRLLLRTIPGAIVVPVTALRHGSNGDYAYVLNAPERTVSLRNVERGQTTAEKVQIVKGLEAGEVVITEGADRLKDGARVTLADDAPPAAAGPRGAAGKGERGGSAGKGDGPRSVEGAGKGERTGTGARGPAKIPEAPPAATTEGARHQRPQSAPTQ
jgi:multidrug efflux system membrane fusion protein